MLTVPTSDYKNEFVTFTKLSEEIKNVICIEYLVFLNSYKIKREQGIRDLISEKIVSLPYLYFDVNNIMRHNTTMMTIYKQVSKLTEDAL